MLVVKQLFFMVFTGNKTIYFSVSGKSSVGLCPTGAFINLCALLITNNGMFAQYKTWDLDF